MIKVEDRINGQEVRIDPVTGQALKRCAHVECERRGEWLPLDDFVAAKKGRSGRCSYCRRCMGRLNHIQGHVEKNRLWLRERGKVVDLQISGLMTDTCDVCEEGFERWLLEFHHIDPRTKEHNLGDLRTRIAATRPGTPKEQGLWELFISEASKCLQVCPICHKGIHHFGEEAKVIPERMKSAIRLLAQAGGVKMGRRAKYKPE